MKVAEHNLFPTKLLSIEFADVEALNAEVYQIFSSRAEFQADEYLVHADLSNLLDLTATVPCIKRLGDMFMQGLERWLSAENLAGEYNVGPWMFANFAKQYQFTLPHNHDAHVAGIYYVKTAVETGPVPSSSNYWAQDSGALVFHDPRFNSSLMDLTGNHHFKLYPRPGQMLIFPGFLWHSVTPNLENFRRRAISVNFHVTRKGEAAPRFQALTVKGE